MIASMSTYYIIIGVIVAIAGILYLLFKRRNKGGISSLIMVGTVILLIVININVPRCLTVEACEQYTEEVILFPTTLGDAKTSYGKFTYIINNSEQPLGLEYVYYGSNVAKDDEEDVLIMPKEVQRVKGITIDYLFTEPENTVSTKSDGVTKTHLLCLSLEDLMEESEE